jgi:hypothetical protein
LIAVDAVPSLASDDDVVPTHARPAERSERVLVASGQNVPVQNIRASAPIDEVVALASIDEVGSFSGEDRVVAAETADEIVACASIEDVIPVRPK